MRYFSRVSCEDFLEAIRVCLGYEETREKRLDDSRMAEENKHSKEYEKLAKKRLGDRERKQRLCARKKKLSRWQRIRKPSIMFFTILLLSHIPYPRGIAEASRPY